MNSNKEVLLDTCVLINFAAVGRIELLASLPGYSFVITDHVRYEVKDIYLDQFDAMTAALAAGTIQEIIVDSSDELVDFASLVAQKSFGMGECSAIAAAKHRGLVLAIDDRRARNRALAFCSSLEVTGTAQLVVELIRANLLSVEEADELKGTWETSHRFKLQIQSFSELVDW